MCPERKKIKTLREMLPIVETVKITHYNFIHLYQNSFIFKNVYYKKNNFCFWSADCTFLQEEQWYTQVVSPLSFFKNDANLIHNCP